MLNEAQAGESIELNHAAADCYEAWALYIERRSPHLDLAIGSALRAGPYVLRLHPGIAALYSINAPGF